MVGSGRSTLPELGRLLGAELGWREFSLAFTGQRYAPAPSVHALSGTPDTDPVDLVGLEAHLKLRGGWFALWDMAAAARGKADGYMDVLMGLGYALPLDQAGHWAVLAKFCGGPAGGGNLDVGGGMAWKGTLGAQLTTSSAFQIGVSSGYITTPGGSFKGAVHQLQAGRRFDLAAPGPWPTADQDLLDFSGWSVRAGWQRLGSPQRRGGANPEPIELTTIQLAHEMTTAWYFAGQGNFGITGHAGGFAEGLLGLGWRSPELFRSGPRLLVQCLAGAAGGGGVDTGGGLLVQPMLGLEQGLGQDLSLQILGGRCLAARGELRSSLLDAGLVWRFGLPTRTRR